ncbi:MAG: enoyl-CoA hydratase/isomerase family protein [Sphingobium sp.]|nr:enoyl-CoA hydratase/isomerase family protein [Sphingobium sp.]
MTDQPVSLSFDENVAIIRLNRPDRLNALTFDLLYDFLSLLNEAEAGRCRAILLTGAGRAFSAGADLADEGMTGTDPGKLLHEAYHPLLRRLAEIDIPIVSAINGPAAGSGVALALAADISVMARSAYLQVGFVHVGLVPDSGLSWLLARSIGRTRALEMALLGERIGAERALAMGLVTRVVDDESCFAEALALARRLAAGPPLAIGLIRRQIAAALDSDHEAVLALEAANQSRAGATEDFREGVAAFLEKRHPSFEGR